MKILHALLAISVAVSSAQPLAAQPARTPTENVTVTGTKSRKVLDKFVASFATPTRLVGKIARWENGVCPLTVGLRPEFTKFVTKRVREVASLAGAPVNADASCTPNLQILFSAHPQILLDNVRKKYPQFLGYYDNSAQLKDLATVTRPIQAWYMIGTKDLHGQVVIDGKPAGMGVQMHDDLTGQEIFFPNAHTAASSGTRLDDGLRSMFYRVTIVIDPDKLVDYEIGSLADYIAMLALTQLNSLDTCQQLPSIVNMLVAGCERKTDALTDNDLGYLRGLYKMNADRTARSQQDEIAYQMEKGPEGR
jgi:hypothetical protein